VAKTRTKSAQNKLKYDYVLDEDREIPAWIDDVLRKAVHPNPYKRYEELSEFLFELRHPNRAFLNKKTTPAGTQSSRFLENHFIDTRHHHCNIVDEVMRTFCSYGSGVL
jgi:hypothetical protein